MSVCRVEQFWVYVVLCSFERSVKQRAAVGGRWLHWLSRTGRGCELLKPVYILRNLCIYCVPNDTYISECIIYISHKTYLHSCILCVFLSSLIKPYRPRLGVAETCMPIKPFCVVNCIIHAYCISMYNTYFFIYARNIYTLVYRI